MEVASDQEKTTFANVQGLDIKAAWCSSVSFVHDYLLIYLDDVIVYSPDFQSPQDHLEAIVQCLSHGLKLYRHRIFQVGDEYMGCVVSCVYPSRENTNSEGLAEVQKEQKFTLFGGLSGGLLVLRQICFFLIGVAASLIKMLLSMAGQDSTSVT